MTSIESDMHHAIALARRQVDDLDFDCCEVVSSEIVGNVDANPVFQIVIRLWTSPENIEKIISQYGQGEDVELMREILHEGNKLRVEATRERVIKQDWIGAQFS